MTDRAENRDLRMRRIGVVGAGVIGTSVAQALAQTDHDVVVVDTSNSALVNAETVMRRDVRFHHLVAGTNRRLDVEQVLQHVEFSIDYGALGDVDFVIENTTEAWPVKREVLTRLDEVCPNRCSIAANTSAIPITKLANVTRKPERVVGMHFMNPVPLKPVVEVIAGHATSEETMSRAIALLRQMGKEAIVVGDSPGFVSNRVLMLTVNEAAFLVHEEVAPARDVDDIFKRCFGHSMGPLETADLIGIDTVLLTIEVLREELASEKYAPCPLLRSMVATGKLGRKTAAGFYEYGPPHARIGDGSVE